MLNIIIYNRLENVGSLADSFYLQKWKFRISAHHISHAERINNLELNCIYYGSAVRGLIRHLRWVSLPRNHILPLSTAAGRNTVASQMQRFCAARSLFLGTHLSITTQFRTHIFLAAISESILKKSEAPGHREFPIFFL